MIPFDFQPKFGRDSEEGFRLPLRFVWDPSGEIARREREWRNTPRLAPPGEALSSPRRVSLCEISVWTGEGQAPC